MVLFKRKPVQFISKPPVVDDAEVWTIEETDEVFANYEDFIRRMDFYRQRRFICEITGHSNLTFKEALRSEKEASGEVDDAFPDSLREPILRKVQFLQMPRVDHLVDYIFDEFKADFYPGEKVIAVLGEERYTGLIREKTKFPELTRIDGTIERRAFARYFVELDQRPGEQAIADEEALSRDRKAFTKLRLKSFLKNAVTREAWTGAPWIVKPRLAEEYRLPTDIPPHLTQEAQAKLRKSIPSHGKKPEFDGSLLQFSPAYGPQQSFQQPLKPKGHKHMTDDQRQMQQMAHAPRSKSNNAVAGKGATNADHQGMVNGTASPNGQGANGYSPIAAKNQAKQIPAPPPPPKYPIEDLELPPTRDGTHRPNLKFLSQDTPTKDRASEGAGNGISMESVGFLLETWDTLNVYCEVFQLDSFTFDDYVEALRFTSEDVQCELLVEIHCAVLKKLVNETNDKNGQVQIILPYQPDSDDEDSEEEESSEPSPEPEPEPIRPTRTTRSSLIKSAAAELREATNNLSLTDNKIHQASEMDHSVKSYDWKKRLQSRDFQEGRWVVVIVGLFNQLASNPRMTQECNEILKHLAPLDQEPTAETAFEQYQNLDINLRIRIIQILCLKSVETKTIRQYMEDCSVQMTETRKEKNGIQRLKKAAVEEMRRLHEERKALEPEGQSPPPSTEIEALEESKQEPEEEEEAEEEEVQDSDASSPHQGRSLRRANDRALARKQKAQAEKERKAAAAAEKAKKPSKQERQHEKVLRKIEEVKENIKDHEEDIATLENDLREADCPRTRCLGKDRFWNRYYWMERNAMPYAGLPDSSTANAGYANGCIWVQGPDDMERIGFIELSDAENDQYKRAFQMTVPERKMKEEGETHVLTARQWGYYDDPDYLDMLIGWLDVRGVREMKLRKELQTQREKISLHMRKRQEYLNADKAKSETTSSEPVSRVSTRTKTYVNPTAYRCLSWKNNTAVREIGHLHSEPKPPAVRKQRGVAQKKSAPVEVEEAVPVARSTRGAAKTAEKNAGKRTASGRMPTRQGSRYDF